MQLLLLLLVLRLVLPLLRLLVLLLGAILLRLRPVRLLVCLWCAPVTCCCTLRCSLPGGPLCLVWQHTG